MPSASGGLGGAADLDVVIAYDFLNVYSGAERIAAEIAGIFPEAPFWAITGRRGVADRMGIADRFFTLLPQREGITRRFRAFTPGYPLLVRTRRLPEADVFISTSFAFAHGLRTANDAPQVCYCFSPLRFAWSMTKTYGSALPGGRMAAAALRALSAAMRATDRAAARRVDRYVAESQYVADQIERFYGRRAEVIYPPVDCDLFRPGSGHDGYYLFCGRLIEPYKRPTAAVEAFASMRAKRLLVAGDGPALPELRRLAPPNVEFLGQLGDTDLVEVMQRCAAVVFPSKDDFGLIPVEVMACGRPVIAHAGGGALETVVPGRTGELFAGQSAADIVEAVSNFDPDAYDPAAIRAHAERWRRERFVDEICSAVVRTAGAPMHASARAPGGRAREAP